MSVAFEVDAREMDAVVAVLNTLGSARRESLLEALAFEGEQQTRRRLAEEKTSPDGTPWAGWSPRHARTRHGGQSLLEGQGDLIDSITSEATESTAEWGSNLRYAAIHQLGGRADMAPGPAAIPARPFLGLSDNDAQAMLAVMETWLARTLRRE